MVDDALILQLKAAVKIVDGVAVWLKGHWTFNIPLIFYKIVTVYFVKFVEDMTHSQALFVWLPYSVFVVLSAADAILILARVGFFEALES